MLKSLSFLGLSPLARQVFLLIGRVILSDPCSKLEAQRSRDYYVECSCQIEGIVRENKEDLTIRINFDLYWKNKEGNIQFETSLESSRQLENVWLSWTARRRF